MRVFRMTAMRGKRGLEFRTSEINCEPLSGRKHDPALLEHAVFGETDPGAGGVDVPRSKLRQEVPRSHQLLRPGKGEFIAGSIGDIIDREQPDLWNLVAPPELSTEIEGALDQQSRDRLTSVQIGDLLEVTAEAVEERFHPLCAAGAAGVARRLIDEVFLCAQIPLVKQ